MLPAYHAAHTLERTVAEPGREVADDILLVDDASTDATAERGSNLDVHVDRHQRNQGYGGTRRPATGPLWREEQTSRSWFIRINSIHPG